MKKWQNNLKKWLILVMASILIGGVGYFSLANKQNLLFQEDRHWQIASDQAANMLLLWDSDSQEAPTDWTCVSCTSTDPFYEKFIRGNSSYGSTGETTTHSHTNPSPVNCGATTALLGSTSNKASYPALVGHTHTANISSGLSGTNIPEYKNLKVIRYNYGAPPELPSGVIAIFDNDSAIPENWATSTYNDDKYVQGNTHFNVSSTGGNNTHSHTVVIGTSTAAAAQTSFKGILTGGIAVGGAEHTHSGGSATSSSSNHEPPYITVILAKNNNPGSVSVPAGMIAMFDGAPSGSWESLSGFDKPFHQRFFKPTGVYGNLDDSLNHNHDNLLVQTGLQSHSTQALADGTSFTHPNHTHNCTVTFNNAESLPPYRDVIFARNLGPSIAISGTVYADQGISTSTKGSIIHLAIDGSSFGTTTASTTDGSYLFGDVLASLLATSTKITVFIDDTSTGESGAVVTKYSGSGNIENLDIYVNHVILRHEDEGPITNQDIAHYATSTPFSVNAGPPYILQVDQGHTLLVLAGKTYEPTWNVFTSYLTVNGALEAGGTTISLEGSGTPFVISGGGTFNAATSTIKYVSVQSVTDDFYNEKKIATSTNLEIGTAAGEVKLAAIEFVCSDNISYGGDTYNTIQIGGQCWLKENLKVTNGNTADQSCPITRYCYDNNSVNCDTYGGLYVWNDAMCGATTEGAQGICPDGWHVPTDGEWTTLTAYLSANEEYWCDGNNTYIAKSLASQSYWSGSTIACDVGNATSTNNLTGFTVLPGGDRLTAGSYDNLSNSARLWSSTESGTNAWFRNLYYYFPGVIRNSLSKADGFSVRCLRE